MGCAQKYLVATSHSRKYPTNDTRMPQSTVTRVPNLSCTNPDGMLQKDPMFEAIASAATSVCV